MRNPLTAAEANKIIGGTAYKISVCQVINKPERTPSMLGFVFDS